jgi:hypothetical protein
MLNHNSERDEKGKLHRPKHRFGLLISLPSVETYVVADVAADRDGLHVASETAGHRVDVTDIDLDSGVIAGLDEPVGPRADGYSIKVRHGARHEQQFSG